MKSFKEIKLLSLMLGACFFLVGCGSTPIVNKTTPRIVSKVVSLEQNLSEQSKIKKFNNAAEFKKYLEEHPLNNSMRYGMTKSMELMDMAPVSKMSNAVSGNSAVDIKTDYSKTNIQVEGVDESDLMKTDGKYFYIVSGETVSIVDGYPAAEAKVISTIDLKSTPQGLYLNDNKLVVYGYDNLIYTTKFFENFRRQSGFVFFKIFDVADKTEPKLIQDLSLEGSYTDSRMVNGYVYLITNSYGYTVTDDAIMPRILENNQVISGDKTTARYRFPDIYYFNFPYNSYNLTNITAINTNDASTQITSQSYLLPESQTIYASQNNLYLTYTKYLDEWEMELALKRDLLIGRLSTKDQDKINKIDQIDGSILSSNEKNNKVNIIIDNYIYSLASSDQEKLQQEIDKKMKEKYTTLSKEMEKTVIHKINFNKDKLTYQGFGEVTGQVLNQFSMDENNGYFRLATTKNRSWSRFTPETDLESYSNLFILDNNLKQIGSLENLAKSERIYSVRFMGDRAYIVTFKQTDPLFVVDMLDPKSPRVAGELKIPGFSSYLHPYDENTIIGLGKQTEENSNGGVITKGLKISLFNVNDISNPKEVTNFEIGGQGSDSFALNDHKALLFSKEKNLMVIPANLTKENSTDWKNVFNGALVFNINASKLELTGKISHQSSDSTDYSQMIKRSAYINNSLYTISNDILKINDLTDLADIKSIKLTK